jgi:hypothetical protein
MHLYEFADPTKYILPETDPADPVKQSKNINTADKSDVDLHLRKKPETKKPMDTL